MMGRLRKILIAVVVIFVILVGLVFSLNNQVQVSLNFIFFHTPALGVAFWLIIAFVIGGLLGVLLTSALVMRQSMTRRRLERRLGKTEKALERQRSETAKGL